MMHVNRLWLGRVSALVLSACGGADRWQEELQQWMTEQRNQTQPKIQPIAEPKMFTPQAYMTRSAQQILSATRS